VLVISSRKGEYETGFEKGGQTREHAQVGSAARMQRQKTADSASCESMPLLRKTAQQLTSCPAKEGSTCAAAV
jgi:hypothetical protein